MPKTEYPRLAECETPACSQQADFGARSNSHTDSPVSSPAAYESLPLKAGLWKLLVTDGYAWDWLWAAIMIIINYVVPTVAIKPINRLFFPNDPTLNYPLRDSTVPTSALYILTFLWPAIVFTLLAYLQRSWVDWHHIILSGAEGFGLTLGLKRWINLVGRLRPNWLANVAAANAKEISDARLSYPSGHSAYIFYSATMLSLYLLGKTRVLVEHRPGHFLIASLCLIPMGVAAFVAVSRIADYKHDPSDVNAGSFIGIMCGAFGYMLNFDVLRAQAWCRQRQ